MQGIKDLFASERGIFAIILSLSSTVLAILGRLTVDQWFTFNQWLGVTLIASKTATGMIEAWHDGKNAAAILAPPLPPQATAQPASAAQQGATP